MCDAVKHIHSHSVIHRDIKPANILVKEGLKVKLADFGLGHLAEKSSYFKKRYFSTQCGTPNYMAPEVMANERYHNSADIYSMGAVLEVLLDRFGEWITIYKYIDKVLWIRHILPHTPM